MKIISHLAFALLVGAFVAALLAPPHLAGTLFWGLFASAVILALLSWNQLFSKITTGLIAAFMVVVCVRIATREEKNGKFEKDFVDKAKARWGENNKPVASPSPSF